MIGVVLATHQGVGEALVECVRSATVVPTTDLVVVPFDGIEPLADYQDRLRDAALGVDHARGLLLVADQIGSTPANAAAALANRPGVELVYGVNLPMLIKILDNRHRVPSLERLAALAVAAGRDCIRLHARGASAGGPATHPDVVASLRSTTSRARLPVVGAPSPGPLPAIRGPFGRSSGRINTVPVDGPASRPADGSSVRLERRVRLNNLKGLHTRTSSLLVRTASAFESEVHLVHEGEWATAKSILQVLALGAAFGTELTLVVEGPDAHEAMAALVDLFERGFRAMET